nr:hypothetical protein [Tanacetum cinerariifolium]
MHTCASNFELINPLPEPERTMNRRLHRRNKRVPFDQRNNPPQNLRFVYPLILDINYYCHFLVTLENLYLMDDEPMWAADRVVALTPGFAITISETANELPLKATDRVVALTLDSAITISETANEFAIIGNYLTLVKGNQFDGRTKTYPHKNIHEFLTIYDMFKYRDTKNEAVCLMMFPLSLTREAKTWLNELNEETIETFGVDAVEDFKEYTLRDYYCWLKTKCCQYKLKLLDNAADSRLRLLEQSAAVDDKMKKHH